MIRFLTITLFLLVSPHPGHASSAYKRLRAQFLSAQLPSASQLQASEVWHCSGSLKAAKGIFRYVDYWEPSYQFELQGSVKALNYGPRPPQFFQWTAKGLKGAWPECSECPNSREYLRANENGDLLIEVVKPNGFWKVSWPWKRKSSPLKDSISEDNATATHYFICENPQTNTNSEWYRDGQLWFERFHIFGQ